MREMRGTELFIESHFESMIYGPNNMNHEDFLFRNIAPLKENGMKISEPVQKPYNRELWRIGNGILEEDLVNFVLDKSKKKIDQLG